MRKQSYAQHSHPRAGTYLLELLVIVGVSSLLMGLATVAVHQLLTAHSDLRDTAQTGMIRQRLVTLFRNDCREANTATLDEQSLRLQMRDGREVRYDVEDNVVFRSWTSEETDGRDRFYSTQDWSAVLALDDNTARLVLSQSRGGSKHTLPGTPRQLVTEATVGSRQRLAESIASAGQQESGEDKQ